MENYFDHIQDYLDGTLSESEREAFERQLQTDENLRSETAMQLDLREILSKRVPAEKGVPSLKRNLDHAGRRYITEKSKTPTRFIRWLVPAAAAATCLLVFDFFGWFTPDFERLPEMPLAITRGVDTNEMYSKAARAFNNGEYEQSAELLESLAAGDTTVVRNRYYLGLSYFGQEQYTRAANVFRPIAEGHSQYAENASYFMAVSLWRVDNPTEARRYAERVSPQSQYHKKAVKLLKRLPSH